MRGMYSKLPRFVYINKEKFIINTDFRIFIDFEEEMVQGDPKKATVKALTRFYPAFSLFNTKEQINEATNKFIWFYKCGKEDVKKNSKGSSKESFRYSYDDLRIWGAYKYYFNIDLTEEKLHWWKFKAYWLTLPSEAEFSKIKGYRAYSGKDKDLLELQDAYKLPKGIKDINDEIRRNKLYEALK